MATYLEHREFTDPDQMASALPSGEGRWTVIGRGLFRVETTFVEFDRVSLQFAQESLGRLAHHAMKPGKVGVLCWPRPCVLPVVRGMQIRPAELMSLGLGMDSYHRTSGGVVHAALVLDADVLERLAIELCGRELRLESGILLRAPEDAASRFLALINDASRVARESPAVLGVDEAARGLEQALLGALIECVRGGESRPELEPYVRRAQVMARFERVVEAHADRPLHLPDLCRLVGVPERTLRKCCQQHLGMGPHRYLLLRRIHLARRALQRGDPLTESVTSIATRLGFWELGRFAALYRSWFGEPPSSTLRRRQAEFA